MIYAYNSQGGFRTVAAASDAVAGEVVFTGTPNAAQLEAAFPTYAATLLAAAQIAQTSLITAAHDGAIATGPSCSALGTAAAYPLPAAELANLQLAYAAAQAALANPKAWAAAAAVPLYEVALVNGAYYLAMTAGTTGAAPPAWPTRFQQAVADGSVSWALAGWQLMTATAGFAGNSNNGGEATGRQWHTPPQVVAVWQAALDFVAAAHAKETILLAEIIAAPTVAAVQAVVWS